MTKRQSRSQAAKELPPMDEPQEQLSTLDLPELYQLKLQLLNLQFNVASERVTKPLQDQYNAVIQQAVIDDPECSRIQGIRSNTVLALIKEVGLPEGYNATRIDVDAGKIHIEKQGV